uniref:Uncharacterized protein n=1 Tax=Brassica campestris TaxID=3711 RepID=A0A3P5YWL3_BRACM|nr:unnamed protein product [Brassica rapa]
MHAPVSPLNSRAALKTNVHLFPVVLHLLGSSSFKNKMVTQQILTQLANLTKLVEASFQLRLALASALEMETKDMEDFLEPPLSLCRAFLPTVTCEQERRKSTELQLLVSNRILHCLGYACKQYLSPAMILSISGHDVYKINAIVSEMKNSDVAGLNSVASLVAVELQRLPR